MSCVGRSALLACVLLLFGGCATRPVNAPIAESDPKKGYQIQVRQQSFKDQDNLVVIAFSAGVAYARRLNGYRATSP